MIHLKVPLYILDQSRSVGREAIQAAPQVDIPVLLIQGTQDSMVKPEKTQHLKCLLKGPVTFVQVNGPHSLTMPHNPAFEEVLERITLFVKEIPQDF